jgi:hypothetical protein
MMTAPEYQRAYYRQRKADDPDYNRKRYQKLKAGQPFYHRDYKRRWRAKRAAELLRQAWLSIHQ